MARNVQMYQPTQPSKNPSVTAWPTARRAQGNAKACRVVEADEPQEEFRGSL